MAKHKPGSCKEFLTITVHVARRHESPGPFKNFITGVITLYISPLQCII